jgi:hypothetical protein
MAVAIPGRVVTIPGMLVAIPGTVVAIRRKTKQDKEFGRRLHFWHPRPFAKESRDAGTETEHEEDSRDFAVAVGV